MNLFEEFNKALQLKESLGESSFEEPIRIKISSSIEKNNENISNAYAQVFRTIVNNIIIRPEILIDNSDGTGEICFPGRQDLLNIMREEFSKHTVPGEYIVED